MLIGLPKEIHSGEKRTALVPDSVKKITRHSDLKVNIEKGVGEKAGFRDEDYVKAGAQVFSSRNEILSSSDMILRVRKSSLEEISLMKKGTVHISFLDPFQEKVLIQRMAQAGLSAISMEMIPRITRAQKMDALSSQASLAGYVAVILAAERLPKVFPMMMTPAGTISPARVFIIGAGVAGLQAIATAKRLGARVEAFDTRPVVEEQVQSLGARFIKIELGETGETKGGYAKTLTEEQMKKQREAMSKHCRQSDVVITTAQVFGKKAPLIITHEMITKMSPGSVVVDLAVESGGNVEDSRLDEDRDIGGVHILGLGNLPGRVSMHASQMYSNNLTALIEEYWDEEKKSFEINTADEIMKGCLLSHQNEIVNPLIKDLS